MAKTKKETAAGSGRGGSARVGKLFERSTTSVLRVMGSLGFTPAQARQACDANGATPQASTIKIQLGQGRRIAAGVPSNGLPKTMAELSRAQLAQLKRDAGVTKARGSKAKGKASAAA